MVILRGSHLLRQVGDSFEWERGSLVLNPCQEQQAHDHLVSIEQVHPVRSSGQV